jgi:lysozyme
MIAYKQAFSELADEEGLCLKSYRDTVGIVTIGIGHNVEANPTGAIIGRAITKSGQAINLEEALKLFEHDYNNVVKDLDKNVSWWRGLDDARQYVLISMCFNLGVYGLLKFKNTLHFVQTGEYEKAAKNMMLSQWYKQVKRRGVKLVKIMQTGKL